MGSEGVSTVPEPRPKNSCVAVLHLSLARRGLKEGCLGCCACRASSSPTRSQQSASPRTAPTTCFRCSSWPCAISLQQCAISMPALPFLPQPACSLRCLTATAVVACPIANQLKPAIVAARLCLLLCTLCAGAGTDHPVVEGGRGPHPPHGGQPHQLRGLLGRLRAHPAHAHPGLLLQVGLLAVCETVYGLLAVRCDAPRGRVAWDMAKGQAEVRASEACKTTEGGEGYIT